MVRSNEVCFVLVSHKITFLTGPHNEKIYLCHRRKRKVICLVILEKLNPIAQTFEGKYTRGGGGGGATLVFSSFVGSDPASTVHPKKYQVFQAPKKNI